MTTIDTAVSAILARRLPPKYNGRKDRWKAGKMGLASKIKLLQEFGYKVDVAVTPPDIESPIFDYTPEPVRPFKTRARPGKKPIPKSELP